MLKNRKEIAQAWMSSSTASFGFIGEKFGVGRHTVRYIVTSLYRGSVYDDEIEKRGFKKFTTPADIVVVGCAYCGKDNEVHFTDLKKNNFCNNECRVRFNAENSDLWSRNKKKKR